MSDPDRPDEEGRLTSRSIRSFVIRNGRMTAAQSDAIERLMPNLGIDFHDRLASGESLDGEFGRRAPLWIEVGIGNGDALLAMAAAHPEANFVGIEVHAPGIGHALLGIEAASLGNVRLIRHDALEVLERLCAPESAERVLLFFPDPWHKKRHHKRRIVQRDFLDAVAAVLVPGGLLHCATDVDDYALWMLEHLNADERFDNTSNDGGAVERPEWRISTRFERRGERLGHRVHDFVFRRLNLPADEANLPNTVRETASTAASPAIDNPAGGSSTA